MQRESLSESAPAGEKGFTLVELIVVIAIVAILVSIAIGGYKKMMSSAYKVTMKHDLQNFVKGQESYLIDHTSYLGNAGDYIQGNPDPSGTLPTSLLNFIPSAEVRIEITSGPPAFKAKASHNRTDTTYEFDFVTRQMTER
jgi:prepilin-type N-terminal cleavage/methylation domain-containing protein